MFNFRYVFLLFVTTFTSSVFAADYYWDNSGHDREPSPHSLCQKIVARTPHESNGAVRWSGDSLVIFYSTTSYACQLRGQRFYNPTQSWVDDSYQTYQMFRRGDNCPSGTTYNAETGICDPDEPEPEQCEAGQSSSFEFLYCYSYDGGDGCSAGTSGSKPGSFCRNSCVHVPDYNPGTTDADCYSYQNGDGTSGPSVFCSVTAETNGSECSGEYSPESPDNSCPSGSVPGQVNGKNVCVPSGDGGGDGGDNGGGDGGDNGGGDGGENGGGDGDGDGDGTGGNGDGTGGNGNGNGNGDGTGGNGDGTGGTGTGGDGDGEGDGSGSAEGVDNCESGRCDFGDDRGDPFGGEVRSFSESLTAAMTGMKNSPLGNSIGNIQFPTGGACPTGSTSIGTPFGSMSIDFESHCTLWEQIAPILSAVFLAFWAILAVRVFLSA